MSKLTDGSVYVCTAPEFDHSRSGTETSSTKSSYGPHPAGTVGLHIHSSIRRDVSALVWHLGAQDVVAIGKLFETGKLFVDRVVSLGGPVVKRPD